MVELVALVLRQRLAPRFDFVAVVGAPEQIAAGSLVDLFAHGRAFSQSPMARVNALPYGRLVPAARIALACPTAKPSATNIQSAQCAPLRMRSISLSASFLLRGRRFRSIESVIHLHSYLNSLMLIPRQYRVKVGPSNPKLLKWMPIHFEFVTGDVGLRRGVVAPTALHRSSHHWTTQICILRAVYLHIS